MTKNEKKLIEAINACNDAGDWDVLHRAITKIVIEDARNGLFDSKRDRKTVVGFVDLYGTPEQRVELDHVFE